MLSLIAVALFLLNYHICDLLYHEDVTKWYNLKMANYAIIISISMYIAKINQKRWIKFILNLGVGLSSANAVDRIIFNSTVFTYNDYIMIFLTLTFSIYEFYNERRRS